MDLPLGFGIEIAMWVDRTWEEAGAGGRSGLFMLIRLGAIGRVFHGLAAPLDVSPHPSYGVASKRAHGDEYAHEHCGDNCLACVHFSLPFLA